jgi:hypothetical protein
VRPVDQELQILDGELVPVMSEPAVVIPPLAITLMTSTPRSARARMAASSVARSGISPPM